MQSSGKKILFNIGDQFTDLISDIDVPEFDSLTRKYDDCYALFKPMQRDFAEWAVKLPSLNK